MLVLVLNAGSSSHKSCLYSLGESLPDTPPKALWEAHLDWTVTQSKGMSIVKSNGVEQKIEVLEKEGALRILFDTLINGKTKVLNSLEDINVVGHRVVHGGAKYSQPTLIDDDVKSALKD